MEFTKMQVWSVHCAADVAHTLILRGLFAANQTPSIPFEVYELKDRKEYYEFVVASEHGKALAEIIDKVKKDSQWA